MPTRSLGSRAALVLASLPVATLALPLAAQRVTVPDIGPYLIADGAAEVALARSAAPKAISDSATVLVLRRTGFVEGARGSNGFTCAVFRSFGGPLNDPDFWDPHVRAPHCFNSAAARTVLPAMLKQTELVLAGQSRAAIGARIEHGYATHEFPSPAPGAMAYMLSPEQTLTSSGSHWMPHLMFYYDKSLPASMWGAGDNSAPVIDGSASDPHAPVLTLFVPVRRWSNGALALGK